MGVRQGDHLWDRFGLLIPAFWGTLGLCYPDLGDWIWEVVLPVTLSLFPPRAFKVTIYGTPFVPLERLR